MQNFNSEVYLRKQFIRKYLIDRQKNHEENKLWDVERTFKKYNELPPWYESWQELVSDTNFVDGEDTYIINHRVESQEPIIIHGELKQNTKLTTIQQYKFSKAHMFEMAYLELSSIHAKMKELINLK